MERLTYRTIKDEAMGNSSVADIGDILGKARCKNGELQIVNAHIIYDDFPYWKEKWSEIYEEKK